MSLCWDYLGAWRILCSFSCFVVQRPRPSLHLQNMFLWTSRPLDLIAPGHGCSFDIPLGCRNPSPASPHADLGHYLFTDSRRLIWKKKKDKCSPWQSRHASPLRALSLVLKVAAVLLKLCQVPLGCVNPTVLYLLCRWACNDLKVFSTVFLLKQGMQSLEDLLDVILWKEAILLLSAGGKLTLHFHLAYVPPLSWFPCQPLGFCRVCRLHLAPWWTVHRQHKDFSISSITLIVYG